MVETIYNVSPTIVQTTYTEEKFHSIRFMTDAAWKRFHEILLEFDEEKADEALAKVESATIHTWKDWHLIPLTRPVINPPEVKTNVVDIPGSHGVLDLSEVLTGSVLYGNRTGSIQFVIINGYWESWIQAYSTIMYYLHGHHLYMILEDEPNYVYEGRFTVKEWTSNSDMSTITIDYDLAPYKRELISSLEPWLWDPFNFVEPVRRQGEPDGKTWNGTYISDVNSIVVNTPETNQNGEQIFTPVHVVLENGAEEIIPYFIVSLDKDVDEPKLGVSLEDGVWYWFEDTDGKQLFPELVLKSGMNDLYFRGFGTVSIDYRRGYL